MCERRKIRVNGIVQGVGFRPFIFNLAHDYKLTGFVSNTSEGVVIEAEGTAETLDQFQTAIRTKAPPLAFIIDLLQESIPVNGDQDFVIIPSDSQAKVATLISPDIAVCDDCLQDLRDPANRRYRYPFTNCTNCGPRYTIIEELPYDRPFTSMCNFKMCPDCQAEYDDPTNRRFHAQPNACSVCGPQLSLYTITQKAVEADDLIRETARLLKAGKILAIKGLAGFHLAVDATNTAAVKELRRRKNREEKPLAVMVKDPAVARKICELVTAEEELLASPCAPIVLARKRPGSGLADEIAPGNDRFGVMLPYTPLHHLLLAEDFSALVMTSANLSEEPICIANDEAFERLQNIADYVLLHDRDIYLRGDDSVFIHLAGKNRPIRRSRGYAPMPIMVKSEGPPVLAVGGELKNTVCLLQNNRAFLSQHIGDLENLEAYNFFRMTIDHLQRVFDTRPELIVHDLHPRYLSTQWAKEQDGIPLLGVQHHHAHLAAVMAEHGIEEQVLGIIMDGTGYSIDGTIWGGEILLGDYSGFKRLAAFEPMLLPGGDAAIRAPWRTAVSYLLQSEGELPELPFLGEHDYKPIVDMVEKNVSCFTTSSCGRLFDAVAAMSGGRQIIHYEGQAAIELMQLSDNVSAEPFKYEFRQQGNLKLMLVKPLIRAVVKAIQSGCVLGEIGSRFHRTLREMLSTIVQQLRRKYDINTVVVSGGVFQNQILFEALIKDLEKANFSVFSHEKVPTNDGGIALGQALIGRKYLENFRQ
ncbi:MAG: carbamoyltransferase HypF [Candidatus Marinimicrobia bacterium]|nr:carbamoyltransferase HypF [Candidatus Neomarinimicrobiota bacterium]